jgi:glycine/D-amino acid oxidase-like deaminating enzyme/nitrite reductase/ring-hydroxylating ferredoxin subunit
MAKPIKHESVWLAEVPARTFPPLDRDLFVDVVIIGGGITGLTAGHQLKKAGLTVAVLEQHAVASGESGHTTAHLTQVVDAGLTKLTASLGMDGARTVWDAGRMAIEHIAETDRLEQIDCNFRRVPGYLYAASTRDIAQVENELELAQQLGYRAELAMDPGFPLMKLPAMVVPNQAQFNPRQYLVPLAKLIHGDGSFVFERSHAAQVHHGAQVRVEANGFVVTADNVIYATHQPIHDRLYVAKVAAYQTYVVAAKVAEGTFPFLLAWDTENPYHYWRQEAAHGYDLLIVGGEDHRTGQEDNTEARFGALETYVKGAMKGIRYELTYRWSGQVLEPMDHVPFIGRLHLPGNAFVATGFSGNGMTMGTFAGLLLTDLILGNEPAAAKVFDPNRFRVAAGAVTFIEENLAFPTYLALDRLQPASRGELDALAPGEGKIIQLEGERVAASKDPEGNVHAVTAVCPHMGCIVHWNSAAVTWDCPCHGSRFMTDGKVLSGPATSGLAPAKACLKTPAPTPKEK